MRLEDVNQPAVNESGSRQAGPTPTPTYDFNGNVTSRCGTPTRPHHDQHLRPAQPPAHHDRRGRHHRHHHLRPGRQQAHRRRRQKPSHHLVHLRRPQPQLLDHDRRGGPRPPSFKYDALNTRPSASMRSAKPPVISTTSATALATWSITPRPRPTRQRNYALRQRRQPPLRQLSPAKPAANVAYTVRSVLNRDPHRNIATAKQHAVHLRLAAGNRTRHGLWRHQSRHHLTNSYDALNRLSTMTESGPRHQPTATILMATSPKKSLPNGD